MLVGNNILTVFILIIAVAVVHANLSVSKFISMCYFVQALKSRFYTIILFLLARVKVPEELRFANACCVGLTSCTVLSILNLSEHWLQVNLDLVSVMLDGEKVCSKQYFMRY